MRRGLEARQTSGLADAELVERFVRGDEVLSRLPADAVRRIKAEQAIVAELEPERGLQSLPKLLADPADRRRALAVLDEAVAAVELTAEQLATVARVRAALGAAAPVPRLGGPNGATPKPAGAT